MLLPSELHTPGRLQSDTMQIEVKIFEKCTNMYAYISSHVKIMYVCHHANGVYNN